MSFQPYNDLETLKEDRRRLKENDEGGGRVKVATRLFCIHGIVYPNFLTDFCL